MIKRKYTISPLLVIFLAMNANAVVKIDHGFEVEQGLSSVLSLDFEKKSGATDKEEYEVEGTARYRSDDDIFISLLSKSYGKTNGVESSNDEFAHLRYIRSEYWGRFNAEAFVQHEADDFKALASRNLVGAGVSYITDKNQKNKGWFQSYFMAGIMREREEHLTDDSLDEISTRMTFSARFKYQNEYKTTFYVIAYYQPKVDQPSDSRSVFETGFDVPVIDSLSVGFNYQYLYDTTPFAGIPKTNEVLSTNIKYSF